MAKGKTRRKSDGREQATIDLTDEAAALLNGYCVRSGRSKKFVLSRLVTRFAEISDAEKTGMLGAVDEGVEAAYAALLCKLADRVDPAAHAIRVSADTFSKLLHIATTRARKGSIEEWLESLAGPATKSGSVNPPESPEGDAGQRKEDHERESAPNGPPQ